MQPTLPTLEEFRADMLASGYDEVLERTWAPDTVLDLHTHPFEARALVVQGEMWLQLQGQAQQHLQAGDRFHVLRDAPHAEKYGPTGATYWVARKN